MNGLDGSLVIALQAGATWPLQFVCKYNSAGAWGAIGDPVDLTGWGARAQIRASLASKDALLSADTAAAAPAPRMSIDGPNGIVYLTVEAADTAPLALNGSVPSLPFGIELFQTVGGVEKVVPLVNGLFSVMPDRVR